MMHAFILRGIGIVSLVLLPVAAILPWYTVPVDIREVGAGGLESWCPTAQAGRYFAAICVAVAVALVWGWCRGRLRPGPTSNGLVLFLIALFFFPYCISIFDPPLAAQSAWLFEQHENLTTFEGDYSIDQELGSLAWRRYVYVNPGDQKRGPVFQPLVWGPEMFQLGNLQVLMRALGYTDAFCQFFGIGWIVAVVATLGLLTAAWSEGGVIRPGLITNSARFGLAAGFVCIVAALSPMLVVALKLAAAQEATARGEYESAASHLEDAAAAFPLLNEDAVFTLQRGLVDWRLGRLDSPQAQIYRAELYERQGQDSVAEHDYRNIMVSVARGTPVHHEACLGLLRIGIVALNTGLITRATELIETVLAQEPCNLKANFALQLAYLRASRRPELERLVKRVERIYARYQFPTKMLIVSFSHENAKLAAYLAGDLEDAIIHDFRAKHPEVASKSYRLKHP
jgi:hypothetical protein